MSATGASTLPSDPSGIVTDTTAPVQTAGGSDVSMADLFANDQGCARRIYCPAAGNIAIKRKRDTAFVVYPVPAGFYIDGRIVAVGGTSSGTDSGFKYIPEC